MAKRQNLPTVGEIEQQLLAPWFTANIDTGRDGGVIVTTFDWHGEKFTKLMLHSVVGSQTMILDLDALQDIAHAFVHALESVKP